MERMIIAVDFDGTLCENCYPEIGAPRTEVIEEVRRARENGAALILWTCRCGIALANAVRWCANLGIQFYAINDNLPETIQRYGSNSRKIYAHRYLDDKAVPAAFPAVLAEG